MLFIFETETTGPSINKQHHLIEIACLRINDTYEIIDTFHTFLNPQRKVDIFAYKVHGKNLFDLRNEPLFSEIVDEFLEFIQNDTLVRFKFLKL